MSGKKANIPADGRHAPLPIGQCAALACLLDATVPKPGNVHRGIDFEDVTFWDFAASAVAIGPVMQQAGDRRVGKTVLAAIEATRNLIGTNTNLGMVLLVAPLAAVPRSQSLADGIAAVLRGLNASDSREVYQAIRLAQPGGMGRAGRYDLEDEPPHDLLAAMCQAAPRDLVARQYTNNFHEVLLQALPRLSQALEAGRSLSRAMVDVYLWLMAQYPDTLIARKCGEATAVKSAALARVVLDSGPPGSEAYVRALADLDFWLRSDGHRRNPGTTADLVAAALFAALREGIIGMPLRLTFG